MADAKRSSGKKPDLKNASREELLTLLTKALTKNQQIQKTSDGQQHGNEFFREASAAVVCDAMQMLKS